MHKTLHPNQRPPILYICLTSEADGKELPYLQCHANCSVFQVLICFKSKEEKSDTSVLSLVLGVSIPPDPFVIYVKPYI